MHGTWVYIHLDSVTHRGFWVPCINKDVSLATSDSDSDSDNSGSDSASNAKESDSDSDSDSDADSDSDSDNVANHTAAKGMSNFRVF
jgi:hypothetical protein